MRRKRLRGVAILTVLIALALMMAIITDLATKETIYYKLALNERDALQAEALAQSGANFAQLILMVEEPLQGYLTKAAEMGIQMPGYMLHLLFPIDSDLLKGAFGGELDIPDFISDKNKDNAEAPKRAPQEKEIVSLEGPYEKGPGGYGAFRGRFSTEIEDEDRKISIKGWAELNPFKRRKLVADLIFRLLSKPEHQKLFDGTLGDNKNVMPAQLVANIYDWLSKEELAVDFSAPADQWGRLLVGDKKTIYIDSNLLPKRASMDSIAELRLVHGMTDAIYQLLSKHLTIYGESGKINILSASDEVMGMVFYMCTKDRENSRFQQAGFEEEMVAAWNKKKAEGEQALSVEAIIEHLEQNRVEADKEECRNIVGTASKTFTVKSTATVGNVSKIILMRLRSSGGITTIYQYQYL
jgi:type II secretory pathway component PulK